MNSITVKVENLGKKYVINHKNGNGNDNFLDIVIGIFKKMVCTFTAFKLFDLTHYPIRQSLTDLFKEKHD